MHLNDVVHYSEYDSYYMSDFMITVILYIFSIKKIIQAVYYGRFAMVNICLMNYVPIVCRLDNVPTE